MQCVHSCAKSYGDGVAKIETLYNSSIGSDVDDFCSVDSSLFKRTIKPRRSWTSHRGEAEIFYEVEVEVNILFSYRTYIYWPYLGFLTFWLSYWIALIASERGKAKYIAQWWTLIYTVPLHKRQGLDRVTHGAIFFASGVLFCWNRAKKRSQYIAVDIIMWKICDFLGTPLVSVWANIDVCNIISLTPIE